MARPGGLGEPGGRPGITSGGTSPTGLMGRHGDPLFSPGLPGDADLVAVPEGKVVLVIDNAPWHHGGLITKALDQLPQLRLYRLPSHSPQLQVIERFWKVLRRRATHNGLFPTQAQLKQALRHSLCYDQTLKPRGLSLIQSPKKWTQLSAA